MAGAIVQIVTNTDNPGASTIAATISGVAAGNHVVAVVGALLGTTATVSISDGGGGTWNNGATTTPPNAIRSTKYSENRSGSITVTATFGSANWQFRAIALIEISGLATSSSLDQATGQHQGGATGTDSITSGNPASTTNAKDFVLGVTVNYNDAPHGNTGTGFTGASGSPFWTAIGGNDLSVESKSVSATGVYPALFTPSANGSDWDTHVLIFKEAAAAAASPVPDFSVPPVAKPRGRVDQAQALPAIIKYPWMPPPSVLEVRRFRAMPEQLPPLPPLPTAPALTALATTTIMQVPGRPARPAEQSPGLPPVIAYPWMPPPAVTEVRRVVFRAPDMPAPLPPLLIAWVPDNQVPLIARAKRIVDINGTPVRMQPVTPWAPPTPDMPRHRRGAQPFLVTGIPVLLPPPFTAPLTPPLYIRETAVKLSIAVTPVRLTIVEVAKVLSIGGPVVTRKQGSTYVIDFVLQDANGARDLTGSSVTLSMRNAHTAVNKITAAGVTIVTPATGACRYTVNASDVDTASDYEILVTENRADGTIAKYPSDGYEPLLIEPSF